MFARVDPPSAPNDLTAVRDSDPSETAEWLDALESVFHMAGAERAEFILAALDRKANDLGIVPDVLPPGPYGNTSRSAVVPPRAGALDNSQSHLFYESNVQAAS